MNYTPTQPLEQEEVNAAFSSLAVLERLLPLKVTPFYMAKIKDEVAFLGHTEGPLHRVIFPSRERLVARECGEVRDFVCEHENVVPGCDGAVQKYKDRVLFMPLSRCLSHCQYCFRQDLLSSVDEKESSIEKKLDGLIAYLSAHSEVTEVILSGGDPMVLPYADLRAIIKAIRDHTYVKSLRVHTRGLIYDPRLFTNSKLGLMSEYGVRLVHHTVHPYEICDEVKRCIDRLHRVGIRQYNQFPLLRKINDNVQVLAAHLSLLDVYGIRNLSVFLPDAVHYSSAYRITFSRVRSMIDELNRTTPSWINSTRVVLDTVHGKVRLENAVDYQEGRFVLFSRGEDLVRYPDLPSELDSPGDPAILLWKGEQSASA